MDATSSPVPPRARWFPFAAAAVVLAGVAALLYARRLAGIESTDDAFLDGHIVDIAPSVAGRVIKVPVTDNQEVQANDLLVEIDPGTYDAMLAQRRAAHGNAESAVAAARAQVANATARLEALKASLDQSKADAQAAHARTVRASADLERDTHLFQGGAITRQQFDQAQADADVARADEEAARQKIVGAKAQVEEARTNLPLSEANLGAAQAAAAQAAASERSASIDLDDTRVLAPSAGRVTRKSVDAGDYVQVGESLFSLVPSRLWVTANFKENQLVHMKPGQEVDVGIDAGGGRSYRAHVDSIQAGSGARFSLFPPENATGNYVKIVQRVPVKIVFDEPLDPSLTLGPGESVEPVVHTGWTRMAPVTWVVIVLVDAALLAGLAQISRQSAAA